MPSAPAPLGSGRCRWVYSHKTGQGPDLEEARLTLLRSMTPITDGRGAYVAAYSINAELAAVVQCRPRR